MDKEKLNTIKFLVIGGFCCAIGGMIGAVFLRRESPEIAGLVKAGGIVLGIIVVSVGVFWAIAGDIVVKKLKKKKTPKELEHEYAQAEKDHEMKLKMMIKQTELKTEEVKQKQMDNRLAMQKAHIGKMNAQAKQMGGESQIDVLGNLSGMLKSSPPQKQKRDMLDNMSGFMIGNQPQQQVKPKQVKKTKKKSKTKSIPRQQNVDDFFIKF